MKNARCLPLLCSFFLLLFFSASVSAQKTVSGRITGDNGQPLPGVTVVEKATQKSVTSKENGDFSIVVTGSSPKLTITYVGYLPREINVGNQTQINLTLVTDPKLAGEVVVVGYGRQKK